MIRVRSEPCGWLESGGTNDRDSSGIEGCKMAGCRGSECRELRDCGDLDLQVCG